MALIAIPASAFAAGSGESGSFNAVLIGLLSLIIVLLFVIGALGSVLTQLGFAYREKLREQRKNGKGIIKTILLLVGLSSISYSSLAQGAEVAAQPAVTSIGGMLPEEFYLLIGVIALELLTILALIILVSVMIKALAAKPGAEEEDAKVAAKKKRVNFWDRFNQAVAVEKEKDILLDHDYDGIQELDNSLPPWWKYGFYLTILIAVVYLWRFHMGGGGPSSHEEYVAEVRKGEAEVAKYLANSANNVDESTVKMLGEADIAAGKNIFVTSCAACHGPDGGGTVGPNLTDQYWLHGGSIKDVFKSIKYGWTDKGMKSWKDDFSPKQIAQLASYVKSLQGTTPAAPKEKQGELYIEAEQSTPADSTGGETTVEADAQASL